MFYNGSNHPFRGWFFVDKKAQKMYTIRNTSNSERSMKLVTFLLVRHGFSKGNKEKRFSGQMNLPLDDAGLAQAESVSKYISENFKVDSIYSSDLSRAYDTVLPLANKLNIAIQKDKNLREVDVGLWQGKLIDEVKKEFPETFEKYRVNPGLSRFDGGESYLDAMERGIKTIQKIAKENDGKTIVIATHGGIIRTLRAAWTNTTPENIKDIPHVPNASVTIAEYDNGNVTLKLVGHTDHLEDKTTEEGVK